MKIPPRKSVLERVSADLTLPTLIRVLHVAPDDDAIVLFPLVEPPKKPLTAKLSKICREIDSDHLRYSNLKMPAYMLAGATEITEAAKRIRDSHWETIRPLIDTGPKIFGPDRGALIKQRATELGKTQKSIYRILYRYWFYGMTKDALIPALTNCGAPGTIRTPTEGVKRGRPSLVLNMTKDIEFAGVNVTQSDRQNFNKAIDLFYVKERKSLPKTFQKMRERFYNDGYENIDGTLVPILKPYLVIPTKAQFRYWFHIERDEMTLLRTCFESRAPTIWRGVPASN
jgi:putative transposase